VKHTLLTEAPPDVPRLDHARSVGGSDAWDRRQVTASAITNAANATLITPFIVKNAASNR
jgi:hypothetical protein